jgi:transcriptional regulator with XRE-family HTH domain
VIPPDPPAASLAELLRAARVAEGLSLRELAERLGLSPSSLSAAERGADVRLATLQRALNGLRGLSASLLLHGHEAPPAFDAREAWSFMRRGLGLSARRVAVEAVLEPDGALGVVTRVKGLRMAAAASTPRRLAAQAGRLVATAWIRSAPSRAVVDALLAGEEVSVREGGARHVAVLAGLAEGRPSLDYEHHELRPAGVPASWGTESAFSTAFHASPGFALSLHVAVARLVLSLRCRKGSLPQGLRACSWPVGLLGSPEEIDLAPATAALPQVEREDDALRVTIERPLPGFTQGLLWGDGMPRLERRIATASRPHASPGAAIARAREAAGLSRRELARRIGTSASTIIDVERDARDLRVSSVRGLLHALPGLRAEHLLRDPVAGATWDRELAWRTWRDLCGFETALLRLEHDLCTDGRMVSTARVVHSRTLPGRTRTLKMITRAGRGETLRGDSWTDPIAIEGAPGADEVTMRFVREGGHLVGLAHVVPAEVAAAGITTSSRSDAELPPGRPPTRYGEAILGPLARLEISLRLPASQGGRRWQARCWPACEPEDPPGRDAWPRLGDGTAGRTLEIRDGGTLVELSISLPTPGLMFALVPRASRG